MPHPPSAPRSPSLCSFVTQSTDGWQRASNALISSTDRPTDLPWRSAARAVGPDRCPLADRIDIRRRSYSSAETTSSKSAQTMSPASYVFHVYISWPNAAERRRRSNELRWRASVRNCRGKMPGIPATRRLADHPRCDHRAVTGLQRAGLFGRPIGAKNRRSGSILRKSSGRPGRGVGGGAPLQTES
jgi:hypothetical protein